MHATDPDRTRSCPHLMAGNGATSPPARVLVKDQNPPNLAVARPWRQWPEWGHYRR
jgi:hypothetical protein